MPRVLAADDCSQLSLEAQRRLREAESDEKRLAKSDVSLSVDVAGAPVALPQPLVLELIDGANAELSGAHEWGIPEPQIAGQQRLWMEGRLKVSAAVDTAVRCQADILRCAKDCAKRDGATAPLLELQRLLEVISQRKQGARSAA